MIHNSIKLNPMTSSIMTLTLVTLSMITLSRIVLSRMLCHGETKFSIMTLCIMTFGVLKQHNNEKMRHSR
jgi:hypothetical protein